MGKRRELFKNTCILFLGKVFTQMLSFLLLPLYTTYLTTDEYGTVDLVTTYIMLIMPLVSLQIERAAFRFLVEERNNKEESELIVSAIARFLFAVLLLFTSVFIIASFVFRFNFALLIYVYCVLYLCTAILLQIVRGFGKNDVYAKATCILGAVTVVSNLICLSVIRTGVSGMYISFDIAYFAMFAYLIIKNRRVFSLRPRQLCTSRTKKLLKYSIPLIPDSISWWILNVSDRTILSYFLGNWSNGIYAVANRFSSLYVGGFNIANMAWQESVSLYIGKDDNYIRQTTNDLLIIFSYLCSIAICAVPIVFAAMVGDGYSDSYWHIPILLLGALFTVGLGLLQSIYIGLKQTKKVAKTSVYCAILNILINFSLINIIGVYAASISTLCSYFVLFIYRYFDLKKSYGFNIDAKRIIAPFMLIVVSCLLFYCAPIQGALIGLVIISMATFLLNRKTIKSLKTVVLKNK